MKHRSWAGIITGILILIIAGNVIYHTLQQPVAPEAVIRRNASGVFTSSSVSAAENKMSDPSGTAVVKPDATQAATGSHAAAETAHSGPEVTKAGQRDATHPVGPHKVTIDPMASWHESPPWPEGPHLLADVETSGKRYVNLRPNDKGLMPRLNVNSNEHLAISLSLPDSDPGSSIHVELPNGGRFPDEDVTGKLFVVSQKRTVSFMVSADGSRGFCTVNIRQAGHTRCLPLWVGELEALASEDTN